MKSGFYRNLKTGNRYTVVGEVVNATNVVDGQIMVLYMPIVPDGIHLFVREKNEFLQKFERESDG